MEFLVPSTIDAAILVKLPLISVVAVKACWAAVIVAETETLLKQVFVLVPKNLKVPVAVALVFWKLPVNEDDQVGIGIANTGAVAATASAIEADVDWVETTLGSAAKV
jgi:hypothetical protein